MKHNGERTETPSSSSSSKKQRYGRILLHVRTVLPVAIALCSVANFWFAATAVDHPQQQQQPLQESFRMDSKNKKLIAARRNTEIAKPPKTHHVSSKPVTVSKPVNEDASNTSATRQTASKTQDLTENTGKQLTTSTSSQQQTTRNIADVVLKSVTVSKLPKNDSDAILVKFNSTTQYSALPVPVYNCTNHYNRTLTLRHDPQFIIAGVQKGGTSALYALLRRHPNILPTKAFEPHFFDLNSAIPDNNVSSLDPQWKCYFRARYSQNFNFKKITPEIMTFEKTPAYLGFANIPKMITDLCFWRPKIIVVLRNPVDRAHSHYRMNVQDVKNFVKEFPTFDDWIRNSMKVWRLHNVTTPKLFADFNATAWLELPDSAFTAHDVPNTYRRRKKSNDMLRRGLYAQQLKPWLDEFELGKDLFVVSHEKLLAQKLQVWHEIIRFVGAPAMEMDASTMDKNYSPNRKAMLRQEPLSNATRAALQRLYQPYNDKLADLLGESWRGVWD